MKTKICRKCARELSIDDFPKKQKSKDGLETICRDCYNERKRKWYKSALGKKAYLTHKKRARKKKRMAVEYLGNRCHDCGQQFEDIVYDFHHLNPDEKDKGISSMRMLSWESIKDELDKCILLCANCHRLRHNHHEDIE